MPVLFYVCLLRPGLRAPRRALGLYLQSSICVDLASHCRLVPLLLQPSHKRPPAPFCLLWHPVHELCRLPSQAPAAWVFARASGDAPPAAPRSPSLPLSSGESLVPCRTTRSKASSGPPPARKDRLRKRGWPDPLHRGQRTVPMELLLMGQLLVKDLRDLLALQLRPRRLSRHLCGWRATELHERPDEKSSEVRLEVDRGRRRSAGPLHVG